MLSAISAEVTCVTLVLVDLVPAGVSTKIPSPALVPLGDHAASDRTVTVPRGGCRQIELLVGFVELLCSLDEHHSLARVIAFERVSSAEHENPSNTNLFRSFQRLHKIQGTSDPAAIPAGGKQTLAHIVGHTSAKSIIPL